MINWIINYFKTPKIGEIWTHTGNNERVYVFLVYKKEVYYSCANDVSIGPEYIMPLKRFKELYAKEA